MKLDFRFQSSCLITCAVKKMPNSMVKPFLRGGGGGGAMGEGREGFITSSRTSQTKQILTFSRFS